MTLKNLLSASALIAFGMLAGRVLGLLREMLLAAQFGTSGSADHAILLLIIPDFITAALIGSAASAALLPAFAARPAHEARALFHQALAITLSAFSAIALLMLLGKNLTGWDIPTTAWAITLLALPLSAATAIITAWLQHNGRFFVPAFATVIFNAVIITALWAFAPGLPMLAGAIASAALIRLLAHIIAAARLKTDRAPAGWQLDKGLRITYLTAMTTGILGLLPTYIPYLLVASSGAGVAIFNYTLKLVLMPTMLAQTVAQMAVLPWLVSARTRLESAGLARLHAQTLQLCALASILGASALALCATPLAALCFGHGQMTPDAITTIAASFTAGIFAMPALLFTTLLQSMLYAHGNARAPFRANILQAACILPFTWSGLHQCQIPGLLASFSIVQGLPILYLLPACLRQGLLPGLKPLLIPAVLALAAGFAVFAPLALIQQHQEFSSLMTIACAAFTGIVSLMAGTMALRSLTKMKPYV